jgi:hypothetical protein
MRAIWAGLGMAGASAIGLIATTAYAAPPAPPAATVTPADKKTASEASLEPSDAKLRIAASPDGKTLFLVGELDTGSYLKFRRIALRHPKAETLFLGSPGGIVMEGFLIAAHVRDRKMKTYVDVVCSSSCTQIFIAGKERAVAESGKIGFHQSYLIGEDGEATAPDRAGKRSSPLLRASYLRSDIAPEFVDKALSTPFTTMWYPSITEMQTAKVVTRVSKGNEHSVPFPLGQSRSALEADLGKRRLWQVILQKEPALYEKAVDSAWRAGQSGTPTSQLIRLAHGEATEKLMPRIATGPDSAVEGLLTITVNDLRAAKAVGYERCASFAGGTNAGRAEQPVDESEEAILLSALEGKPVRKALPHDKALKKLMPLYFRVFAKGYSPRAETAEGKCKFIDAVFTEINALPGKSRLEAMRNILTIGEDTTPETGAETN